MVDLIHRLRRIAQMAGDARRIALEDAIRADGRGGRALLEQTTPRDVAAALMRLCATLGFEGLDHARRLVGWCHLLGAAADLATSELELLALAAQVHDIGKLGVSAEVLGDDDALTATSLDWIRMHSSLGHTLLAGVASTGTEAATRKAAAAHTSRGPRGSSVSSIRTRRSCATMSATEPAAIDPHAWRAVFDGELPIRSIA